MNAVRVSVPGNYRGYSRIVADGYAKNSRYVTVRDGCRLALDIYRPTLSGLFSSGPLPTVVISTGYRRSFILKEGEFAASDFPGFQLGDCVSAVTRGARLVDRHVARWREDADKLPSEAFREWLLANGSTAEFLLVHGYNIAIIDNRATGASFGTSDGLDHQTQGQDACDIFDWIVDQPWSTDSLAMVGSSWLGLAQNAVVSCLPRHLKAVLPVNAGMDTFVPMYPGGLYNVGLMRQWYRQRDMFERGFVADVVDDDLDGSLRAAAIAERSAPSNDPHWILTIPTASEREAMLERYAGWSRERYQANGRYYNRHLPDGSFGDWKLGHLDPSLANRSGVAYYGYGGFWDLCGYTMAMAYANLTLPRKLLIGPWHHGNWKFSEQQEHLRWLDFHLKGIDNGIMTEPPVTYATSHPELPLRWHSAESFPPAGTTERRFHGRLTSDSKRGRLSEEPVSESRSAAFAVNYDVTSGLASRNWGYNVGPFLHLDALEPFRDQILTLLTDPFEEEVEITGFPTVELTIATTGDSGAVFLYLQDLAPDGSAYYLSDGQLNLCHRKLSEPEFSYLGLPYHSAREADRLAVVPNEKMRVAIALHPVSWRIPKGHRFALTISGADYDNSFQARQTPAAVHTVFAGGESPLVLSLPVMEVGKRPAQIPGAFAGLRAKATRAQRPTLTSWSP